MPLAARLADVRLQLDHPPGVVLGVLRLPILDPVLEGSRPRSTPRGARGPSTRPSSLRSSGPSRSCRSACWARPPRPSAAGDDSSSSSAEPTAASSRRSPSTMATHSGPNSGRCSVPITPFVGRSATCIRSSSAQRPWLRSRGGRPRPAGCSRRRATRTSPGRSGERSRASCDRISSAARTSSSVGCDWRTSGSRAGCCGSPRSGSRPPPSSSGPSASGWAPPAGLTPSSAIPPSPTPAPRCSAHRTIREPPPCSRRCASG